jgi:hypothetical protein
VTYRVEQHHSFVHYLQVVGHVLEIVVELAHQMVDLAALNVDNERVREFNML